MNYLRLVYRQFSCDRIGLSLLPGVLVCSAFLFITGLPGIRTPAGAPGVFLLACMVLWLCDVDARFLPRLVRRDVLARATGALLVFALLIPTTEAQPRFRTDDPLQNEIPPRDTGDLPARRINQYYDFYRNTFQDPGQPSRQPGRAAIAAQNVNTLGEVMNGEWFENRRLSHQQIVRGPNQPGNEPDATSSWTVIGAKTEGVTPGFLIKDAKGRRYLLKFDPVSNPEMATGADVVTAKLLYAIGYHVPENFIVHFDRDKLVAGSETTFTDRFGKRRRMTERDISELLLRVAREPLGPDKGKVRAVASLYLSGKPIGPFKYYGRRKGDLNDYVPHEHRRELRGFHVVSAWIAHHDSRSINSLDMLMETAGVRWVKHYLIDFGSTLGSAATKPKSAREGNAYLYDFRSAALNFSTLGLYVRDWEYARYPYYPAVGRIESRTFDPDEWIPNYRNRAFLNRLPEDEFWAAEKIGRLTDDDIRAVVATGAYSNPAATAWIAESLIRRRDVIVRKYTRKVLPLHSFRIAAGALAWEDLEAKVQPEMKRNVTVRWHDFDNATGVAQPIANASTVALPTRRKSEWLMAELSDSSRRATVKVYLRGDLVIGIERTAE